MRDLLGYQYLRAGAEFDPAQAGQLFTYVTAANGVFVCAARPEFSVAVPVAFIRAGQPLRGLQTVAAGLHLAGERVPAAVLRRCFSEARSVCVAGGGPREHLWWLHPDGTEWSCATPPQVAMPDSVQALTDSDPQTIIEMHSHHEMAARFSATDDADEAQGFKIYAVIGRIFAAPEIRVRVGCYGYLYEIPARDVFELSDGVRDARENKE